MNSTVMTLEKSKIIVLSKPVELCMPLGGGAHPEVPEKNGSFPATFITRVIARRDVSLAMKF
ncbi:hypothetical protein [Edaphovirga cremea]|uniref:hypothetical protein n=1 Tax=Edaphovirga cremea TaxID=2267246 RepID=UPI003988AE4E